MKKIAFLVDGVTSGGVARVAISLARIFDEENIKCTIFSINDKKVSETLFDDAKKIDIDYNNRGRGYFFRLFDISLKLRRQDFTHVFVLTMGRLSIFFSIFSFFLRMRMKFFACEHTGFESYSNFIRLLKFATYPLYHKVIVLTENDRELLLKNNVNAECVYNPSLYPVFDSAKEKNKKRYLSIGHLISKKGYFRLLDIWRKYCQLGGGGVLTIVGNGVDENNLRKYIIDNGIRNIHINSPTKNIASFYTSHDVLLSTSFAEGLPMTFIEAHRFGLPIISYNVKTGPSEIIVDGYNGFLVTDGDDVTFLERMFSIENDAIFKDFSQNSLNTSCRFSPDTILKKWNDLIYER